MVTRFFNNGVLRVVVQLYLCYFVRRSTTTSHTRHFENYTHCCCGSMFLCNYDACDTRNNTLRTWIIDNLWPSCVVDADIIFLPCGFLYLFYFLAYSQPSQSGCLPYLYTWCGLSANLECRSEMCCTRLAGNTGRKMTQKVAICAPSHNFVGLNLRNKGMHRQPEKNLFSSNISTCPHNMVNFGPLAAEIVSLVWGTPSNFNGFRVLTSLLHGTLVLGISQTLRS